MIVRYPGSFSWESLESRENKLTRCNERGYFHTIFPLLTEFTFHHLNSSVLLLMNYDEPKMKSPWNTLDWNMTETIWNSLDLSLHIHLCFGWNKSLTHKVRCENIPTPYNIVADERLFQSFATSCQCCFLIIYRQCCFLNSLIGAVVNHLFVVSIIFQLASVQMFSLRFCSAGRLPSANRATQQVAQLALETATANSSKSSMVSKTKRLFSLKATFESGHFWQITPFNDISSFPETYSDT